MFGLATHSGQPTSVPHSFHHDPAAAGEQDPCRRRARLAELCEHYYPQVRNRVHRLLARDLRRGRPWLAAVVSTGDVVHEVFLGVARDFEAFHGHSEQAFVSYLVRLVRNRLIDTVRHYEASCRDQRRIERDVSGVSDTQASPGSVLSGNEDADLFRGILLRLPERDRALLRGRLEDDESFVTLAKSLGYASADSARKMFRRVQARVLAMMQIAKEGRA